MNRQELEKLKDQLLSQRADLHALEETLEEAGKPVKLDQAMVGRLSRLDAMQRQQVERVHRADRTTAANAR